MRYGKIMAASALGAVLLLANGCTSKVSRVSPGSTIDLSGRWNDADARMVAEDMIKDCLSRPWLQSWVQMKKRPLVVVGRITNASHEHINTETFTKDIEQALLNSGSVEFVAAKGERDQLREEKNDQAANASAQTAKSLHEETGADLMMLGSLNTIVDQEGSQAVLYYQVNMELVEVESNKKVWIGEKKIKKYVERATITY